MIQTVVVFSLHFQPTTRRGFVTVRNIPREHCNEFDPLVPIDLTAISFNLTKEYNEIIFVPSVGRLAFVNQWPAGLQEDLAADSFLFDEQAVPVCNKLGISRGRTLLLRTGADQKTTVECNAMDALTETPYRIYCGVNSEMLSSPESCRDISPMSMLVVFDQRLTPRAQSSLLEHLSWGLFTQKSLGALISHGNAAPLSIAVCSPSAHLKEVREADGETSVEVAVKQTLCTAVQQALERSSSASTSLA
ncbi:MAG: hypothetical protein WDZ82_01700 [Candidatus Paceibacterota bacterium]